MLSGTLTIKNVETDWKTTCKSLQAGEDQHHVRDLSEIILSAPVGDLKVNDLQAGTLKLVVSGGAQVRLNEIQVSVLDSVLSGAGDIQASGTADEIKLVLSGLGGLQCGRPAEQ